MHYFFDFTIKLAKSLILKQKRFVRLSPNRRGNIFFFDKKNRNFFKVYSRERIDSSTVDQVITDQSYDLRFFRRFDELISTYEKIVENGKIPLVVDCGANIGISSRFFAQEFPKSSVVAIEPEINNFKMIRRNCKGLKNIKYFNAAIGSSNGYASIIDKTADNNSFRTSRTEVMFESVEVMSVEKVLSQDPLFYPFIMKIDIEGFEADLFSTNIGWIKKFPLLIIETHDWMLPKQANSKNFLTAISDQNRDFIHRGENIFSISN